MEERVRTEEEMKGSWKMADWRVRESLDLHRDVRITGERVGDGRGGRGGRELRDMERGERHMVM